MKPFEVNLKNVTSTSIASDPEYYWTAVNNGITVRSIVERLLFLLKTNDPLSNIPLVLKEQCGTIILPIFQS